ncbi:anti-sigma factor antagonist [Azospirillum halopraeferens]|uniref:anti-sigma factor antagonist n=1 Tax=Azospirillum halopraeferens TaxID=34010 RepID=UPI0006855D15|nr:anti-sigma factor antagonist [Azospirillum halopraeferens]
MDITRNERSGVTVVAVSGRIDGLTGPELEAALTDAMPAGGALVLDLAGSDYVSSAGLRVVLKGGRGAKQAGTSFALAGLHPQVREVFDVSGFSTLFPIHADADAAVAALATGDDRAAPAAPATAPAAPIGSLPTLLEEVMLLCIDEDGGALRPLARSVYDQLAAGAVLMELALAGRVDSDLKRISVVNPQPTGEPLLDGVLARLAELGTGTPLDWTFEVAGQGPELRAAALDRLIQRGIIRREEGRILWIFRDRRYPIVDGRERREVRARLRDLLLGDDIPDPRDVVLVGLVNIAGLFGTLLTPAELRAAEPRIVQIRKMDLIGQEVDRSVAGIEAAIAGVMGPM